MANFKLSKTFKVNFQFFNIFGIWRNKCTYKLYKYYSVLFICVNLFLYNALLILNLFYTSRNIELIIPEFNFLCTEVAVTAKVFTILLKRNKLITVLDILDCESFKGDIEGSRRIVESHVSMYNTFWKISAILAHFSYFSQICVPIFFHLIFNANIELPICKYYFLDDAVVQRYFTFLYIYQSVGMYGHLQFNVNIDTLIGGLLLMTISQVKVLKYELKNFKHLENKCVRNLREESDQINKLNKQLKHYDTLLSFCAAIQDIIGITMFVQFAMASIIICVLLIKLLLPSSVGAIMFTITYFFAIILQIFVPAWLGTQLSYESQDLVFAAYSSEWIPRSERFKRCLKLFMTRANTKIVLTGWRIFPLSLDTFTSIMKTAYSFFTLIRNVQDRQHD